MKYVYSLCVFFIFSFQVKTQDIEYKPEWGKLAEKDIITKQCHFDTLAPGVVMYEFCLLKASLYKLPVINVYRRIKVFDKQKFDSYANVSIHYYSRNNTENVNNLEAQTVNINEDGDTLIYEVDKKHIYTTNEDEYTDKISFSFPKVQDGSILEYRYEITTKNRINPYTWYFQNNLPTLQSSCCGLVGEGINLNLIVIGEKTTNEIDKADEKLNTITLHNLEAIPDEPYCPSLRDYIEQIQFQLGGYFLVSKGLFDEGDTTHWNFITNWDEFNKKVYNTQSYKFFLSKKGFARRILKDVVGERDLSDEQKVREIYNYVCKNTHWNEKYKIFPNVLVPKEVINNKNGNNSAEINLFLVLLLRQAGFEANPVLIGTNDRGLITRKFPVLQQFNHVLATVRCNEKQITLDAIYDGYPLGLLPKNDLNYYGFVLGEENWRWLEIEAPVSAKEIINGYIDYSDVSKPVIKMRMTFSGYVAVMHRSAISASGDIERYLKKMIIKGDNEVKIDTVSIDNLWKNDKPLKITFQYHYENSMDNESDLLFIRWLTTNHSWNKNPFVNPKRQLPVDLYYPYSLMYNVTLRLPEGYEIAEIPENVQSRSGNKISYIYSSANTGNQMIQNRFVFQIINPLFDVSEYSGLRDICAQLIKKGEEQIFLKKKSGR